MNLHDIQLEIMDLTWEEWMISITSHNTDRLKEIRDRLVVLEYESRINGIPIVISIDRN